MNSSSGKSLLAEAKLFELSPHHVDEGGRIGYLHEDKAAALGRLMAVDGQRDPIKVVANTKNPDKPWRLVTGMHRLIGARIEGITVHAIEVFGNPEDLVDLESSENLDRIPRPPLELAKFTAALVFAAQERIAREHGGLKQQQIAVKARWARVKSGEIRREEALKNETEDTCANIARVYGWEESVGEALGRSKRSIYNALSLYRLLIEPFPPEMVEALAKHPTVGENASQLKAIADVKDEVARRKVIELLLEDDDLSADTARAKLGISSATDAPDAGPHQKYFNQIMGGWGRLALPQKREFLPNIVSMLTTPGLKKELRDLLDKELSNEG